MDKLIMSKKEREQIVIFKRVQAGEISQKVAAQSLNISERWVRKKLKRYRIQGDIGLIHKNRGKISPRRWDETLKVAYIKQYSIFGGP